MADVFAQGMLSIAYLGRLITNLAPQNRLQSFSARFVGITYLVGLRDDLFGQGSRKVCARWRTSRQGRNPCR